MHGGCLQSIATRRKHATWLVERKEEEKKEKMIKGKKKVIIVAQLALSLTGPDSSSLATGGGVMV